MARGTRRRVVYQKFTNILYTPNIVGAAVGVVGFLEPVAKLSGYTMSHLRRQDSANVHVTRSSVSTTFKMWKTQEITSGALMEWP
jgi:hypothetical protein